MNIKSIKFENQNSKEVTLSEYMGTKGLVIFFYPMAKSPGCSIEAQKFEMFYSKIRKSQFGIVGVSKSKVSKNLEFKNNLDLSYDLLTDADFSLAKELGAMRNMLSIMGTKRTTIILDPNYNILKKWSHASILKNANDVFEFIQKYNQQSKAK